MDNFLQVVLVEIEDNWPAFLYILLTITFSIVYLRQRRREAIDFRSQLMQMERTLSHAIDQTRHLLPESFSEDVSSCAPTAPASRSNRRMRTPKGAMSRSAERRPTVPPETRQARACEGPAAAASRRRHGQKTRAAHNRCYDARGETLPKRLFARSPMSEVPELPTTVVTAPTGDAAGDRLIAYSVSVPAGRYADESVGGESITCRPTRDGHSF